MTDRYREQHKRRLGHMPWLYSTLKAEHRTWAEPWQSAIQAELTALETVTLGERCFVAPDAAIFAEPGRPVTAGDNCLIAAGVFLHGPITLGRHVSINHGVSMDGGRAGITVGDHTRIACHCTLFAFNHGTAPDGLIRKQPVTSRGIRIGIDVWVGAHCSIVDGVEVGDGSIIGMGSVVTRSVPPGMVVAGNPARVIRPR